MPGIKGRVALTLVVCACGILSSAAYAGDLRIRLEPDERQHQRWDWGRQSVDDPAARTVVRLMPTKVGFSKRASFNVYVLNRGTAEFDFAPENVAILLPDGTRIPMLNFDDLSKQERKREGWQNVLLALSMIGNSMAAANAGNTYGTATVAGTGGFGTITYSGYNGAAAAAASRDAAQENAANAERLAHAQSDNRAAIDNVMQRTTVDPGATVGGIVYFDLPAKLRDAKEPVPVTFIVQAGAEAHVFAGKLLAADKPDPDHPDEQKLLAAVAPTIAPQPVPAAQGALAPIASTAELTASTVPVFQGDPPRPYRVLGAIRVVLKRMTSFSAPITAQRAFDMLAGEAVKMHADAVVHAALGKQHGSFVNYKEAEATGIAVKFD